MKSTGWHDKQLQIQRINGIYSKLITEQMSAAQIADFLNLGKKTTINYLNEMEDKLLIEKDGNYYRAVPGVRLPVFTPSRIVCNDDEDTTKRLHSKASKMHPIFDPMLWLMHSKG